MVSICLTIKRPITSCLIWTSVISCYECKAVALSPKFSFIIHMELHEREDIEKNIIKMEDPDDFSAVESIKDEYIDGKLAVL